MKVGDVVWASIFGAELIAIGVFATLDYGLHQRQRARCEMLHGTVVTIDDARKCVPPGGIKTINMDDPK